MNKAFQGRQSGFTLIEIMLTFCILILIIGIGALSLSSQSSKKKITEPALELTSLARQGMQMAITNRRPFVLAISENSVSLENFSRRSNSFGSFSLNDDIEEGSGKIQSFELPEVNADSPICFNAPVIPTEIIEKRARARITSSKTKPLGLELML